MDNLEKVLRVTPYDFQLILENGEWTFHDAETGEEITVNRDEIGTRYLVDTGYLEMMRIMNQVSLDSHKWYTGFDGEHNALKNLDAYYEDIVSSNPGYSIGSAYGYERILRYGDTIPLDTVTFYNDLLQTVIIENMYTYVNGVKLEAPYTCTVEDGCELVSVWVFETYGQFSNDAGTGTVVSLSVIQKGAVPPIPESFIKYAQHIKFVDYVPSVSPLAANDISTNQYMRTPNTITKYELTAMYFNSNDLADRVDLTYASFPNMIYLHLGPNDMPNPARNTSRDRGFTGCSNPALVIHMPNLRYINAGHESYSVGYCAFKGVYHVVLPKTLIKIFGYVCADNKYITLECATADIHDEWCYNKPANGLTLASGWRAHINLAVAAKGLWTNQDYIDFLSGTDAFGYNNLFDFRVDGSLPDDHEAPYVKIANIDLTNLASTDEGSAAIQAAIEKGWSIDGI